MKKNSDASKITIPKNSSLIILLFLISMTVWLIFLYFGIDSILNGFSIAYGTSYGLSAFCAYIFVFGMIGFPILLPTLICIINYFRKYFSLSLICQKYLILSIIILSLKAIIVFSSLFSQMIYEIKIFDFIFVMSLSQIILLIIIILAFLLIVVSFIWRYIETKKQRQGKK